MSCNFLISAPGLGPKLSLHHQCVLDVKTHVFLEACAVKDVFFSFLFFSFLFFSFFLLFSCSCSCSFPFLSFNLLLFYFAHFIPLIFSFPLFFLFDILATLPFYLMLLSQKAFVPIKHQPAINHPHHQPPPSLPLAFLLYREPSFYISVVYT